MLRNLHRLRNTTWVPSTLVCMSKREKGSWRIWFTRVLVFAQTKTELTSRPLRDSCCGYGRYGRSISSGRLVSAYRSQSLRNILFSWNFQRCNHGPIIYHFETPFDFHNFWLQLSHIFVSVEMRTKLITIIIYMRHKDWIPRCTRK
jgi:hypothetical protein